MSAGLWRFINNRLYSLQEVFSIPGLDEGVAHLLLHPPISNCLNQTTPNSFYNITAKKLSQNPSSVKGCSGEHPSCSLGWLSGLRVRLHTSWCRQPGRTRQPACWVLAAEMKLSHVKKLLGWRSWEAMPCCFGVARRFHLPVRSARMNTLCLCVLKTGRHFVRAKHYSKSTWVVPEGLPVDREGKRLDSI